MKLWLAKQILKYAPRFVGKALWVVSETDSPDHPNHEPDNWWMGVHPVYRGQL